MRVALTRRGRSGYGADMTSLAVILIVIGLIGLFLGVFIAAVKVLLWIGIVLLIIGIIVGLLRFIRRNA